MILTRAAATAQQATPRRHAPAAQTGGTAASASTPRPSLAVGRIEATISGVLTGGRIVLYGDPFIDFLSLTQCYVGFQI